MEPTNIQPEQAGTFGYQSAVGLPWKAIEVYEVGGGNQAIHYVAAFIGQTELVEVGSLTGRFCGPIAWPPE